MHGIKKLETRGGKREGAGRKSEGKERFTVTLTAANVTKAKFRAPNFSGLLDKLLSEWIETHDVDTSPPLRSHPSTNHD